MALADLHHHYLEFEITLIEEVHPPPPSSDTMSSSIGPLISSFTDGPLDLSLRCFSNDEEILEALTALEYPWDDMHHRSFFLPTERLSQSDQFSMETNHGKLDWFKNPISAPDAFEEGNMDNILPTIKINISTNPEVFEEIMLGAYCSSEEVASYKALFQEFCNIFSWSYTEMPGSDPSIWNTTSTHGPMWPPCTKTSGPSIPPKLP